MQKPKILILGKLPPPYIGPAIATRILLRSTLNHKYDLLHLNTVGDTNIEAIGQWNLRKVQNYFTRWVQLGKILSSERPDLMLVPISQSTLGFVKDSLYILLGRFFRTTVLIQLRGSDIQNWLARSTAITRGYVAFVLKKAQGVIVQGEILRPLFNDYFADEQILVAHNGCDYDMPDPTREPGTFHVLFLSNLMTTKGIEDALEGLRIAIERYRAPLTLDVVGSWLEESTRIRCEAFISQHDLPVRFHGPAYDEEKLQFLVNADVFLYPPTGTQGHSWVLVEALAAGLPVIASRIGPVAESVLEGINGFIVDPNQPDQIAKKLAILAEDRDLRTAMGKASRSHYLNHFTEEKMVGDFSRCFDEILRQNRS